MWAGAPPRTDVATLNEGSSAVFDFMNWGRQNSPTKSMLQLSKSVIGELIARQKAREKTRYSNPENCWVLWRTIGWRSEFLENERTLKLEMNRRWIFRVLGIIVRSESLTILRDPLSLKSLSFLSFNRLHAWQFTIHFHGRDSTKRRPGEVPVHWNGDHGS
jgi:hypothetical protein